MSTTTPAIQIKPHLATRQVQFHKLLVALDFSAQTPRVLKTAIAVANYFSAELLLVNAIPPIVYVEPVPAEIYDADMDAAKATMAALIVSEPALASVRHQEIVAFANPLSLVQEVVQDKKVDLIIVGSHGASGVERLFLGSVAESILHHLTCPVLIVGPHAKHTENLFGSILFATNLQSGDLRGAQYASGLGERFHGKLSLLHVLADAKDGQMQPELAEQHIRQVLERLLPSDIAAYCTATVQVECGRPGVVIPEIAQRGEASLIVTGVGEHAMLADHLLGSTLAQIIRGARCPILCVRSLSR